MRRRDESLPTLRSETPAPPAEGRCALPPTVAIANDAAALPGRLPAVGQLVAGRYRIERRLGEGGMGTVFLAHDLRLDIDVALKLIRSDLACTQARERLLEEARAAARVSHPSAVRVLDFVVDEEGCPFLVMEMLAGRSLADVLVDGAFAPEEAVRLLLPIIGAAAAAHAEGIVHRDIKPDNILLVCGAEGPTPKLVDFGVARLPEARSHRRLTQAGALIGSPEYMAPEQTEGRMDVDARADVWALCVVLYELVTGITLFAARPCSRRWPSFAATIPSREARSARSTSCGGSCAAAS
jgi:serine/threonine-protein kinase